MTPSAAPIFDTLTAQLATMLGDGGNTTSRSWMPADITVADDRIVVRCDLPGVRPDQVSITFDAGSLRITAEREAENTPGTPLLRERRTAVKYERLLKLGSRVDAKGIDANLSDGVLEIVAPYRPESRPHTITVKGAAA